MRQICLWVSCCILQREGGEVSLWSFYKVVYTLKVHNNFELIKEKN